MHFTLACVSGCSDKIRVAGDQVWTRICSAEPLVPRLASSNCWCALPRRSGGMRYIKRADVF